MEHRAPTQDVLRFDALGINKTILDILAKKQFTVPTPIQAKAIPVALKGADVIGIAQTGTGKTLAFGIPMIERLARHKGRGLIVLPTRELALQVEESLRSIGGVLGMRTVVLIGGESIVKQKKALTAKPHVIICTPGRLLDHMEQKTVTLNDIKILVLDEADRMLDMGFAPQINRILSSVPKDRQTMLFSATMPADIAKIATQHMKLPVRVEVAPSGTAAERVAQEMFIVRKEDKIRLLKKVLDEFRDTVLIFSRTKHGAKKICASLKTMGHTSAEIHANRSLAQRKEALEGFKSGRYRVLVATDIAARGIDVKGIGLVVNFDLPDNTDDYVHRIGRTGRAGTEGRAMSFATPDQMNDIRAIERLIRTKIPMTKTPSDLPQAELTLRPDRAPFAPRARQHDRFPKRETRPSYGTPSPGATRRPAPTRQAPAKPVNEDEEPGYRYDPRNNRGRGHRR